MSHSSRLEPGEFYELFCNKLSLHQMSVNISGTDQRCFVSLSMTNNFYAPNLSYSAQYCLVVE